MLRREKNCNDRRVVISSDINEKRTKKWREYFVQMAREKIDYREKLVQERRTVDK